MTTRKELDGALDANEFDVVYREVRETNEINDYPGNC
jgi:hypothetical protein